jgi:CBS domain-containing protein
MSQPEDLLTTEFYDVPVRSLMDIRVWDVPIITKDEPILLVLSILDGKTHVWVVEDMQSKHLVGVITRHDILHILAPQRSRDSLFSITDLRRGMSGTAKDIMTHHPVTCHPDDKVSDALLKMVRHNIRRLAVVTEEKIEGELTLRNLIGKYYKATQYHPVSDD